MQHYHLLAEFWIEEHKRAVERQVARNSRALRVRVEEERPRGPSVSAGRVVIRRTRAGDLVQLARLCHDTELQPTTEFVVAERSGSLLAAIGVADCRELVLGGRASAEVLALLRLRAEQLRQRAA